MIAMQRSTRSEGWSKVKPPKGTPCTPLWSVTDGRKVRVDVFFKDVLQFYVPTPALILDPTAGSRLMYKRLEKKRIKGYKFVFGDIEEVTPAPHIRLDARQLPFGDSVFDAIVFDPPYIEDSKDNHDPRKNTYGYEEWTREELYELICDCRYEFHRVLKPGGKLIVKIQDQYKKGEGLIEHSDNAVALFRMVGWQLYDKVLYRVFRPIHALQRSRYKYRRHSFIVHTYYLVFRKLTDEDRRCTSCGCDES
jgi:hypothetical protein